MDLITQPEGFPESYPTLGPLRQAMIQTHSSYQSAEFMKLVRDARKVLKTGNRRPDVMREHEWQTFMNFVITLDPKLERYRDGWPIKSYLNHIIRKDIKSEAKVAKARKRPSPQIECVDLPRKRVYVGRPPPPTAAHPHRARDIITLSRPTLPTNKAISKTRAQGPSPITTARQPGDSFKRISVACPKCKWAPPCSLESNKIIRNLVTNPKHVEVLHGIGIRTDIHLRLLHQWKHQDRKILFNWAVDPEDMSPWDRVMLLKKLSQITHLDGVDTNAPQDDLRHSEIPQPSPNDEELITDPKQPITFLRTFMRLDEQPLLFRDICDHIKSSESTVSYLAQYYVTPDLLEATIKEVAATRLVFERYDRNWPIRFLLKRFVRERRCIPCDETGRPLPTEGMNYRNAGPPAAHVKIFSKPAPPVQIGCPVHSGDIPTNIDTPIEQYLNHLGLPELIPVFALVGVTTNARFLQFCALGEEEKDGLFDDRRVVDINAFQSVVMRSEFTTEKISTFHAFFLK